MILDALFFFVICNCASRYILALILGWTDADDSDFRWIYWSKHIYFLGFRDKCCATFDSTLTLGEGTRLHDFIIWFLIFGERVVIDAIFKGWSGCPLWSPSDFLLLDFVLLLLFPSSILCTWRTCRASSSRPFSPSSIVFSFLSPFGLDIPFFPLSLSCPVRLYLSS